MLYDKTIAREDLPGESPPRTVAPLLVKQHAMCHHSLRQIIDTPLTSKHIMMNKEALLQPGAFLLPIFPTVHTQKAFIDFTRYGTPRYD